MPSVNMSRLRSSGILNMFTIAFMEPVQNLASALGCGLGRLTRREQLGFAAGFFDQRLRALAKGMRAHGERYAELAVAQHFDAIERTAHDAGFDQRRGVDHRA